LDSAGIEKRAGRSGPERPQPFITALPAFPHPNANTCDKYVTAECTRVQYNIPNTTTAAPGNELGIFEGIDVHYSRHDLDIYFSTLYPQIPNGTYPIERLVDGAIGAVEDSPNMPVPIDLEAPLDFDSSWPLIYPQKLVLFQEDDEYYESHPYYNGFWNSKFSFPHTNNIFANVQQLSSMPLMVVTALTPPLARPEIVTQTTALTHNTPIQTRVDTKANTNVVFTSQQMSFPSPTETERKLFQITT
jgi:hypothetical protein